MMSPVSRRPDPVSEGAGLLAGQRQQRIADEVRRRGAMRVSELTEMLAVSDMTIRRDLDVLAGAGLLAKVHGGATALGLASTDEPGFEAKSHRQLEEKEAIARRAARSSSLARRSRSRPGRRTGGSPTTSRRFRT